MQSGAKRIRIPQGHMRSRCFGALRFPCCRDFWVSFDLYCFVQTIGNNMHIFNALLASSFFLLGSLIGRESVESDGALQNSALLNDGVVASILTSSHTNKSSPAHGRRESVNGQAA
ncbi:hypothetical protein LY78DRAFT_432596 [Colletotrichum sublineola]|nr:hypothetical protein LY78DRAFT_432596 [Colletotrichum sublineola]